MKNIGRVSVEGFNTRALGEEDFFKICELENISVVEMDVPTSFYMTVDGNKVIVLKRSETGLRRLFSAFHELGHHFLHGGDSDTLALFRGSRSSKTEMEADAFAAIALCPRISLQGFRWLDERPEHYAARIWLIRNMLLENYGI